MSKDRNIIITGATGLIGKEAIPFLIKEGFKIYALTTKNIKPDNVNWINCNIFDFDKLKEIFSNIKAEYLLNFAWITGGDYLTNEKNLLFLESGKKMMELFRKYGGKRAIYAGSCLEYKQKSTLLKENDPTHSPNLYVKCKNELRKYCMEYSKNNDISFCWGRIFYVFGHNENPSRLTRIIIDNLKSNKATELNCPNNKLDYMYSKDIAQAFVELLKSDYKGICNICTGKGILLKDYALLIQEILNKKDLVKFDANKPSDISIIGDNSILKNIIKFSPKYDTYSGLKEILS